MVFEREGFFLILGAEFLHRFVTVGRSRIGITQKLAITAQRNGADFPFGPVAVGKAPKFLTKTDRKIGNLNPAQPGNQKMPEFVDEDQNSQ